MSNINLNPNLKGYKFNDYRQEIWGNSFTWSWERKLGEVQYLAIHHTATAKNATPDQIDDRCDNQG